MTIYNEFDPFASDWLRELVAANLIAQGSVDARDVKDIVPNELVGHRQVHLFAGIGVWSLALRLAGVPDDAEVWTASCPCQPFSAAGRRKGTADERHLWPAAFHLIRHCRPRVVMGEQVASPDGLAWLDVVLADLEADGYACRAVDLCAAGVGAPHIRQRLYWLAYARCEHRTGRRNDGDMGETPSGTQGEARQRERMRDAADCGCGADGLAHANGEGKRGTDRREQAVQSGHDAVRCGDACGMGHAHGIGEDPFRGVRGGPTAEREGVPADRRPGPTNGLWRDVDWLFCRDGKWRPVESSHVVVADDWSALHALDGSGGTNPEATKGQIEVIESEEVNALQAVRGCVGEPPDAVLLMPLSLAFAELRGQRKTTEALLALRAAMLKEGALLDPFDSPEEAWHSLAPVSCERIADLASRFGFQTIRPHPLAHAGAFRNRVDELRGAGNAINVAQAEAFIRANLDVIQPKERTNDH